MSKLEIWEKRTFKKKTLENEPFANLIQKEKWDWFYDKKLKWFFSLGVIKKVPEKIVI